MQMTFIRAGDFLHVVPTSVETLGVLDYDADDFCDEFRTCQAGVGRYRIDARLQRFIAHYFGTGGNNGA